MAYDEYIVERIRRELSDRKVDFFEKKMMGGLIFMVDGKMACGTHFDKKHNSDLLMARIGSEATPQALLKEGCKIMDFTGRAMKDFVFVSPTGFDSDEDLCYYIDACLAFNPFAKASKKKKK